MAIRKNKKRIDPRYFLHETTYRDLEEEISKVLNEVEVEWVKNYATNKRGAALTTDQIGALVDAGIPTQGEDLYQLLQWARQGFGSPAIDLLDNPPFSDDPRIKEFLPCGVRGDKC
jgi:hypothetical protein